MPRALPTALAAALVLAAAGAFWVRHTAPVEPLVLPAGGPVRLLGNDPWFHARHGWLAARGGLRRFDPQADFPRGLRTVHVGGYDALLAAVARGAPDREAAFARFAWVPPTLGALCLLGVALAAGWAGGPGAAALAAGLLLGWPGDFAARAWLGMVDHHVAEPLLGCAALAALAAWLARAHPRWPGALLAALPLWTLLFTWAGAPLWVGVLGVVAGVQILSGSADPGPTGHRIAAWAAVVGLGYGLALAGWPDAALMAPLVKPTLAALAALALAAGLWARLGPRLPPRIRPLALLVGAALALAAAWGWPATGDPLRALLTPRSALVAEHRAVDLARLWTGLGPAALLAPLGLLSPRARPLAVGALALVGLWAVTHDQAYAAPPAAALAAGAAVGALTRERAPWAPWAVGAAAAALWLAAPPPRVIPTLTHSVLRHDGLTQAARFLDRGDAAPAPGPPDMDLSGQPAVLADWQYGHLLAALTGRPVLASHGPSAVAAAFWTATDEDAALAAVCPDCAPGERVGFVVVDAQTAGPELPFHLAQTHQDAAALMTRSAPVAALGDLRFVVPGPGWRRTLAARLWADGGSGLGRLRLVWQSPGRSLLTWRGVAALGESLAEAIVVPEDASTAPLVERLARPDAAPVVAPGRIYLPGLRAPAVRVFEPVPGARVVGSARPGEAVTLALQIRPAAGAPLVWRQDTRADAQGDFAFRAPYPTDHPLPGGAVAVEGQYVLLVGDRPVGRVAVPEAAIQAADTVLLR
ncbi:MAG: hypothetical protein H6702_23250 [Myxococcales bacterium]|nr:hypothetical protein [Myxococcales bacterium]